MKKLLVTVLVLAACAAMCAGLWPQTADDEPEPAEAVAEQMPMVSTTKSTTVPISTEKEEVLPSETVPSPELIHTPATEPITAPATLPATQTTAQRQSATPTSTDPYHTDVYPENVYSEELLYDKDGNLIGKSVTIPTEFGPDTIWIDGHAYYDIPGFGLIEWSGPGQRTEDYIMYESGVKVGIMGDDDEVPTQTSSQPKPQDWPEPTGEVIDQTVNAAPERSSTPPDSKPDTTPPEDPNAEIIP